MFSRVAGPEPVGAIIHFGFRHIAHGIGSAVLEPAVGVVSAGSSDAASEQPLTASS